MNMEEVKQIIDEAFDKSRAEQERLIIKELGGGEE